MTASQVEDQDKALSINKIGHALHDEDEAFRRFCRTPELEALAAEVGLVEPLLIQSMYIFKQPRIGGGVVSHQDAAPLPDIPLVPVEVPKGSLVVLHGLLRPKDNPARGFERTPRS